MIVRPFIAADEDAVVKLWEICGLVRAVNDPRKDICRKLEVNPEMFLVGIHDAKVVASVMVGYEGHRGWINYLAVLPRFQKSGFGRAIMKEAERILLAAGCPKINLQVRSSNRDVIEFYHALGFIQDDVLSFGKRLVHDQKPNQTPEPMPPSGMAHL